MGIIEAVIYGIIQGIAEFLPISSSGHLALAQNFFGTESNNNFLFNIALHLATLVAVCVVYRKDVYLLVKGFFSLIGKLVRGRLREGLDPGERLFVMLCVATLPLIPVKLIGLDDKVEYISSFSFLIGGLLILNGAMLLVSDRLSKGSHTADKGGYLRPLGVGIIQALLGILPGISRSGSTITGGRIVGYSREEAVKFSFLMSIPAILGAVVTEAPELLDVGIDISFALPCLIGSVTAAVVGFCAIKLLQYITGSKNFTSFAVYCMLVGSASIIADVII